MLTMNHKKYQEAIEKSLTVRWKTSICESGEQCWCRIIEPEEAIDFGDHQPFLIARSGDLLKEHAEHIVKLHNESLNRD